MGRKYTTACYRELGTEMRRLREAAGLTARQIERKTGWDPSRISRVESGQVHIDVSELTWYLGIMRVPKEVALPLIDLCRNAYADRGYWLSTYDEWVPDSLKSLIYHEKNASASATYEPIVVPGLLQTGPYARAIIGKEDWRSADQVEACVSLRLERQGILGARPGVGHEVYVHENALRTNIGGPEVMHEQMLALALACEAPGISLRVVPASLGERSVFGGSFSVFTFDGHEPLAYLDSFTCGVFIDDSRCVADYRRLVPRIGDAALGMDESRAFLFALADAHEQGSASDEHAVLRAR